VHTPTPSVNGTVQNICEELQTVLHYLYPNKEHKYIECLPVAQKLFLELFVHELYKRLTSFSPLFAQYTYV
jgi:hypothetical protein